MFILNDNLVLLITIILKWLNAEKEVLFKRYKKNALLDSDDFNVNYDSWLDTQQLSK